jgi:hypothetical protein
MNSLEFFHLLGDLSLILFLTFQNYTVAENPRKRDLLGGINRFVVPWYFLLPTSQVGELLTSDMGRF